MHRFVPYYRVSSTNHGRPGFGLKDQRAYLRAYLKSIGSTKLSLAKDHVELESAKNLARRPELAAALEKCRRDGVTLLIARLKRLSRDATFLFALLDTRVKFLACDMPRLSRAHIKHMALQAAQAANRNSARTKKAMAAAKARGQRFGNGPGETLLTKRQRRRGRLKGLLTIRRRARVFAQQVSGTLDSLAAKGVVSASGVARALNELGILTHRGGRWSPMQVQRLRKVLSSPTV